MIHVFKKTYPHAKFIRGESGEIEVIMPFENIGKSNTPHKHDK
jgi:hypothetical protein